MITTLVVKQVFTILMISTIEKPIAFVHTCIAIAYKRSMRYHLTSHKIYAEE